MRQAQLFPGFTTPVDRVDSRDGVQILTAQRNGIKALRTLRMTEKQVTQCVSDFLCIERGWMPVRTPVGRMEREAGGEFLGPVGRPDWLFLNPHYFPSFMWVEMKKTGESPDPHQIAVMNVFEKDGHLVTWTDCPERFAQWYSDQIESGRLQPIR